MYIASIYGDYIYSCGPRLKNLTSTTNKKEEVKDKGEEEGECLSEMFRSWG